MPASHDSLDKQIADAERTIWSGDERRRQLKAAFKQRAKQGLTSNRRLWFIGGAALAAAGVMLYPRRKAVMGLLGTVVGSPIAMALLQRTPLGAMVMPWASKLFGHR